MQKNKNFLLEFNRCMKSEQLANQRDTLHNYVRFKNQNLFIILAFIPPLIIPYLLAPIIKDRPLLWTGLIAFTAIFSIGLLIFTRIKKFRSNKIIKHTFDRCFERVFNKELNDEYAYIKQEIKNSCRESFSEEEKETLSKIIRKLILNNTYMNLLKFIRTKHEKLPQIKLSKYNKILNDEQIKEMSIELFINLFSKYNTSHYEIDSSYEGVIDEKKLENLQFNTINLLNKIIT